MLSIVTPSYNSGRFIEDTIRSVVTQPVDDIEYIVVDGGSTDDTLDILKKYSDTVRVISEPDHGQADAINKGFALAHGELLAWLNADDFYHPDALRAVISAFEARPNLMMLFAEGDLVDERGQFLERYPSEHFHVHNLAYRCFICQPTVFFRRALIEEAGGLDTSYQYALDLDLWIRVGKMTERHPSWEIEFLHQPLACSRMHASAKTLAHRTTGYREIIDVVKRHFGFVPFNWIYGEQETSSGVYDAYFTRSPLKLNLLVRSMGQWIVVNRYHPLHVVTFLVRCIFTPRRSIRQLSARVGHTA